MRATTRKDFGAVALALLLIGTGGLASAESHERATAELKDPDGKTVGIATLTQTAHGVLLKLDIQGMAPGRRSLHIHEKGVCEGPNFESAGGHFNPHDAKHGFLTGEEPHAGDMPNFEVPASGKIVVERINTMVTLAEGRPASLFGPHGTALVIHDGTDDYKSQPAGDAGDRIACGVVKKAH
jgi:superoxide dismutase, Cu-Zn family